MNDTDSREDSDGYNHDVARQFTLMTLVRGILGMDLGAFIVAQLVWSAFNLDLSWTSFGRIRPIHTNLVIFAFSDSALFATSFYVVQRASGVRLIPSALACFVFRGWQAAIVGMIVSHPLGYTTSKEHVKVEWPLALWMAIIRVVYAYPFFGTIARRKMKYIYVGNWLYDAFIIVTAMVYIVNHTLLPISLGKSYPVYSDATDAMIRWWYGHSVVGFILSISFPGMMYYFVLKQAGRPIYSYRLSIVYFWAIISIYIWTGPHHLHYTALPGWAQSLGMVMSLILPVPNWGGMIDGMITSSGAWRKLRDDPILCSLVVSLVLYGMSTSEGPMMAIKTVDSLSHCTDWTTGHVHAGILGWVAMISIDTLYHTIPKLWGHERMYSIGPINAHFWLATIGTMLYIASMWANGITQGLMWWAINKDSTLTYSFVEVLMTSHPGYVMRLLGGATFANDMLLVVYNTWQTLCNAQEQWQPVLVAGQEA